MSTPTAARPPAASPAASPAPRSAAELARAIRARFPRAVLHGAVATERLSTGVPALDALLGGGLALGRLSVLAGAPSSGLTGLALAVSARVTEGGARVAWVDLARTFYPPSAAAAGVRLERLVVVRPPPSGRAAGDALAAATALLEGHGVALAVLDLAEHAPRALPGDAAAWARLSRAVSGRAACLVLARGVPEGAPLAHAASTVVSLSRTGAAWSGGTAPARLAGATLEAELVRSRFGGEGRAARIELVRAPGA